MKKSNWNLADHPKMPRPKSNDEYLEKMSMVIFSAGLNWSVIDKKWPDIKKLFVGFAINKVAKMNEIDKKELLENPKMIRSLPKINAVIKNSNSLLDVIKEFGSIKTYIRKKKAEGEQALIKDLKKRFAFLGDSTSVMFLYGVGEEMPQAAKKLHHK